MSLIRTIKTGQGVLCWDDETYRAVLFKLTKKNSAKDLTEWEAEKVIKYMRECGFKPLAKRGKKPSVAKCKQAILSKIEALLAENKLSWNYTKGIAKSMFKQDNLEWLTAEQLRTVLTALIYHNKRQKG